LARRLAKEADIDLGRRFVQAQATVSPADAGNQTLLDQQLYRFDHDVRRYTVGTADLADRNEPIVMQPQVDQQTQGVVREFCQRQRISYGWQFYLKHVF